MRKAFEYKIFRTLLRKVIDASRLMNFDHATFEDFWGWLRKFYQVSCLMYVEYVNFEILPGFHNVWEVEVEKFTMVRVGSIWN